MTQPNLEVVGVRAVVQGFDAYVRNIGTVQRSTQQAATGMQQAGTKAAGASGKFRQFAGSAGSVASGLLGVQVGLATVRTAFGNTVGAALGFESSFAGVRKTVEATEEQFGVLEDGLRGLAREIPITVFEINNIAEAAGQLGIETDSIVEFTETMAQLGATTNLSSLEAATALARLANITGLAQDDFEELGSTIVELGNNFATTEAEIVELSLRLAGAGTQIGLSEAEILAFATALSSVGVRAEAGGTAFSRMFVEIEKAVRSGGEDLTAFAEVAGLTAEQFAQAYREDAAGAITTFIEGLGAIKAAGGDVFGVLERLELDNVRVRDALLRTAGAQGVLRDALQTSETAWAENTALAEEFGKRVETTASQLQIARNRITDVGIDLGNALLPVLADAAMFTADWVERLQILAPILPTVATAVGALVAALVVAKLIAFVKGMENLVFAARLAVAGNAPLLIFVGAVTALDVALRAITGAGIIGTLSKLFEGNQAAARGAAEAVREYELALAAAGRDADEAAISLDLFTDSVERQNVLLDGFADAIGLTGPGIRTLTQAERDARAEFGRLNGAIGEQFGLMVEAGVATDTLIGIFRNLTPEQQAIVRGAVDMGLQFAEYFGEITRGEETHAKMIFDLDHLDLSLSDLGDTTEDTTDTFADYITALEDAADANKDLTSVTTLLDDALLENDAAYLGLQSSLADVNIDIATLEAKTGELTKAEEDQLGVLKDTKEALEAQVEAFDANVDAIDPFLDNIAILTGTSRGSLQELRAGLQGAGVDAGAMAELWGAVNEALVTTNAQPAIDELLRIRDVVDDPTFQTIGVEILRVVADGLTDPQALFDLFSQGAAIGLNINAGIESGLVSSQGDLTATGSNMITNLFSAMELEAEIRSPSLRAAQDIGLPIAEGVIAGIVDGIRSMGGKALQALSGFLQNLASTAESRALQDRFGRAGATIAEALIAAIEDPTERAGDRLGDALQTLFDEAEEAGVPLSEAAGQALIDAMATGIELGTPEAVRAALAAVDAVVDAIADAAPRAVDVFNEELGRIGEDRRLEELFGAKGAALMKELREAMAEGGALAGDDVARIAANITDLLSENLGERQGGELGRALMDALRQALIDGGGEALEAVRAILALINAELAGVAGFTGPPVEQPGGGGGIVPTEFQDSITDLIRSLGFTGHIFPAMRSQIAAILASGRGIARIDPLSGQVFAGAPPPPPPQQTTTVTVPGVTAASPETVQGPGAGDSAAPANITTEITIDISGSSFTGSPEENADAIGATVRDILGDEQTVGAFQAGVG